MENRLKSAFLRKKRWVNVYRSSLGTVAEGGIKLLIEVRRDEKVGAAVLNEITPPRAVDVLCVQDRYALSLGSLCDASGLCEQPKKFREGRDRPDVDRIDNAATCEVGDGAA
jgi:hypothetical protein